VKKFRLYTILILTIGVVLFYAQPVLAFPPLPSGFWGTVKVNGANVSAGTVVSARINGVQYASTIVISDLRNTYYSLDIPGDDTSTSGIIEGGVEGNTVVFFIGTIQATQTAIWHSGTNVRLNLAGVSVEPLKVTIFLPLIRR
jgi:hypothetical protein